MNILLACNDILKNKLEGIIKDQIKDCQLVTVCELSKYTSLNFQKLKPEQVFIHVQLDWFSENSINQGYELAVDLMNHDSNKDKFIQVRFFSIDKQQDLIKEVRGDKFFMARSFQHIHLFGDSTPLFNDYSKEHYDFIKLLALKKSGILLFVKHELSRILNNISKEELENQKSMVISHLRAIMFSEQELHLNKIIDQMEQLDETAFRATLSALLQEIDLLVLRESGVKKSKMLNYSVLIVEDDPKMLKDLVDICEENFKEVYPNRQELTSYTVKEALKKLNKKGKDFNVMILDILFEKPDTSFELISGVDFLKLANTKYPYLTTRVVTNVSRQIIGSILDIPIKDLYPKNMGRAALREFIINDIDRIKEDCLAKEKSKRLRNTGPEIGFFSFPGVWDQLESLIESNTFNDFWKETGLKNYSEFKAKKRISNFDGILPKPGDKWKKDYTTDEIEKYLENVFSFRLLFLEHFIQHSKNNTITAENIEIFETDVLRRISNRENCDTSFLNMIAISAKSHKDFSFTVILKKLFTTEVEWLIPQLKKGLKLFVADVYPELADWFIKIREYVKKELNINYLHVSKKELDIILLNKFLDEIIHSPHLKENHVETLDDCYTEVNFSDVELRKNDFPTIAKLDAIFTKFE